MVGDPAHHSLSPAIHRAGYGFHGLDWTYEAVTVSPARLDEFVSECRADPAWRGLSVTAPHKESIVAFGEADAIVSLVGAANTLVLDEAPVVRNTDVSGFVRAWRAYDLAAPKRAAIVGNGATARSLAVALAGLDVRELVVLAREPSRASSLVELGNHLGTSVTVVALDEPLDPVDLVANTIPAAATAPHALRWAASASVSFDVVYDPWPTPLGEAASALGRVALSGLDLLAGQAVDQFALFTGETVTFEQCRAAASAALRART